MAANRRGNRGSRQTLLNKIKKRPKVFAYVGITAILVFAIIFSAVYFIGPSSEGDDWFYSSIGYALSAGQSPYSTFSYQIPGLLVSRFTIVVPIAFFDYVFGPGPVQSAMWNVLAYLLTIVITFFLAKETYNYKVGLLAAGLMALSPVVATYATTVDDDTIMMFMTALMALAFILATKYKSGKWFFVAGTAGVLSLFATPESIEFVVFLALCTVLLTLRKKISWESIVFACAGVILGILIVLIAGYFLSYSGNQFWVLEVLYNYDQTSAVPSALNYYMQYMFPYNFISIIQGGGLSTPTQIINFIGTWDYNFNQAGLYFYAVIPATLYLMLKKERRSYFFVAWLVFILLYLTIGPNTISLNPLSFTTPPKLPRYLMLVAIPVVVLLAMWAVRFVETRRSRTGNFLAGLMVALVILVLLENAFWVDVYNYLTNERQLYSQAQIADYLLALPNNTPIAYDNGFYDTPEIYMHFDNTSRFYSIDFMNCTEASNGSYAMVPPADYPIFNGTGYASNNSYTYADFINKNCPTWHFVLAPVIENISAFGIPPQMNDSMLPQNVINLKLYYVK
jgi:uncharacterized membrane protein